MPTTLLRQTDRVQFTRLDDEWLAIDAETELCFSLNETAALVWQALAMPRSVESICAELGTVYSVDPTTCRAEVMALIVDLQANGLIAARRCDAAT